MAINAGLIIMTRDWALTKRAQYQKVYKLGTAQSDQFIVIKALANGFEYNRYGFSVSKSLGKAVTRNRVRRRLKEIVRLTLIKPGWDIVIIVRRSAADADYQQIKSSVERLLIRAGLLIGNNEGVSAGVN